MLGTPIPDASTTTTDLPLSMSASVVLASLPRDAHTALELAGQMDVKKGTSRNIFSNIETGLEHSAAYF